MPIYPTAHYQVQPAAVDEITHAIEEFVGYVAVNEPVSTLYAAWQQQDDPTRSVHLFIFADADAQHTHGNSEAVRHFESVYTPRLVGGPVVFTNYELVASDVP